MDTMKRIKKLQKYMQEKEVSTTFVFNPENQFYLTGFKALIYSRPIVLHVNFEKTSIIVPGLEETHAKEDANVEDVLVYYEHPNLYRAETTHTTFIESLAKQSLASPKIGVDLSSVPGDILQLLQNSGFEVVDIGQTILEMRYIKDSQEIAMMEEAGQLVNLAVGKSLAVIQEGITEMEIDMAGNTALLQKTSTDYPEATIDIIVMSPSGIKRSIMPHVFSNTRKIEKGDVIIHSRQVSLNGYRAELERTVIVGTPTEEQRVALEAATEAQQRAMEFIKPGVKFSEVDEVARNVFVSKGLEKYAIHRTGHGLGVSAHEKPFLRFDHHGIVEEGMVFSIEPGIYIPGVGGFRHSDTVVITKDGCRPITTYPYEMHP